MARKKRKIKINGTITSDSNAEIYRWFGIPAASPKMLADALEEADGDPVDIYINSPGGLVSAGSEMYSLIKEYDGETTSKITGFSASAATLPAIAADKTLISIAGQMMIHGSWMLTEGNEGDHAHNAGILQSIDKGMAAAYAAKTGKTVEELKALMEVETWMDAKKAVELGFADEVMFDAPEAESARSSAEKFTELPQAVIDKVRAEMAKSGGISGIDNSTSPIAQAPQSAEGDDQLKDLEELKAKHPEIYKAAVKDGITAERARINDLHALAGAPGAADVVKAAIEDGRTASEAAIDIVKASAARITAEGQRRTADAQASGANAVPPAELPAAPSPEAASDAEAAAILAEMKNLKGVKR